jgi:hypothetical protein
MFKCLLLAQWFRRRSLKCEKFTDDRRRTPNDGNSTSLTIYNMDKALPSSEHRIWSQSCVNIKCWPYLTAFDTWDFGMKPEIHFCILKLCYILGFSRNVYWYLKGITLHMWVHTVQPACIISEFQYTKMYFRLHTKVPSVSTSVATVAHRVVPIS